MTATGTDTMHGSPDTSTDSDARIPSASIEPARTRERRHSRRQGADAFDQELDFDIAGGLVAHEPVPQLIVFGFQKP